MLDLVAIDVSSRLTQPSGDGSFRFCNDLFRDKVRSAYKEKGRISASLTLSSERQQLRSLKKLLRGVALLRRMIFLSNYNNI